MALDESDIDEAFIASAGPSSSPARISRAPNTDAAQRKAMRIAKASMAARSCSTSTTGPTSGASPATPPARSATSNSDTVSAASEDDPARLRPDRRHRGGGADRRRRRRHARRAQHHPRAVARRPSSASAGRWAASSITARSRRRSRTASSARASRSRSTTCSAPATPSCPASCAAGCATSRSQTCCDLGQCLRRLRRLAPALLAGIPDLGGAAAISSTNGRPHRALRKDEAINHIHWATTRRPQPDSADGARHRPSHPARGDGRRRRRAARAHRRRSRCSPSRPPRASPTGAPATACCSTKPMAARRCSAPPTSRSGSAARSSCPARARCASRSRQDYRRAARRMAGRSTRSKCLCFYHPDDPAELKREQERKLRRCSTPARTVGRELLVEIIAGKHGPLGDDTIARRLTGSTRSASSRTGGSWSRSRPPRPGRQSGGHRRRTIRCAAASCCSASKRREAELEPRFRASRAAARGQGLRRRPHHLRRCRRTLARRARSTTRPRSTDMAARFASSSRVAAGRAG